MQQRSPYRLPRALEALVAVVIVLELVAPFVSKTFGVDGLSQVNLLAQFSRMFANGVLVPRWAPEGYSGFGVASFYFYPPLSLYVGSIIRVITGITDPKALFQITGFIATIASFLTAGYALRTFAASNYQRWLGAALFAFAPMRVAELYSRSSLSTHVAYVFLPLVWLGVVEILRHNNRLDLRSILLLGVSAALLALTSVPFAVVTAVCIAIGAVIYRERISKPVLLQAITAGVVAVLLYASQLTAVLTAQHLVRLEDLVVLDPEYILTSLMHGAGLPAAYHTGLLYLCVAFAVLASRSADVLDEHRRFIRFGTWVACFIAFLEIPVITKWIWSTLLPFTIIQGVWRFYAQLVFFATVFVAIAYSIRERRAANWVTAVFTVCALIPISLVVFNIHLFAHSEPFYGDPSEYRPLHSVARDYAVLTMKRHANDAPAIAALSGNERVQLVSNADRSQGFDVSLSGAREATFHRFDWPYWHLYANGSQLSSTPDSIGRTVATLPQGAYRAEWRLELSPLERVGLWVSGIAWSALLFLAPTMLLLERFRRNRKLATA